MNGPTLVEVQIRWYSTLAALGFKDIENIKNINGPLKSWSGVSLDQIKGNKIQQDRNGGSKFKTSSGNSGSSSFLDKLTQQPETGGMVNAWPEHKFQNQEELYHAPKLMELLTSLVKTRTKSMSLKPHQLKMILELQLEGMSIRKISSVLNICHMSVHRAQKKMLDLANIIETR